MKKSSFNMWKKNPSNTADTEGKKLLPGFFKAEVCMCLSSDAHIWTPEVLWLLWDELLFKVMAHIIARINDLCVSKLSKTIQNTWLEEMFWRPFTVDKGLSYLLNFSDNFLGP